MVYGPWFCLRPIYRPLSVVVNIIAEVEELSLLKHALGRTINGPFNFAGSSWSSTFTRHSFSAGEALALAIAMQQIRPP